MQCPVCAKSLPDGSERCRWCGADLRKGSFGKKVQVLLLFFAVAGLSAFWLHRNASAPVDANVNQDMLIPKKRVDAAPPDSLDSLVKEANGHLMMRDCQGAVPLLIRVLSQRPDAPGYLLLGKCQLELQQGNAAWDAFEKAKSLGSSDPRLAEWLEKAKQLQTEDQEMGKQQSAHFELWVEAKGATWKAADTLLNELEAIYDRQCLVWNHYPVQKFAVVLFDDPRYRGRDIPVWSSAAFDGKLRIPYAVLHEWPANRRILVHELTHAFVHDIAGAAVAPWLDEGIAQNIDGTVYSVDRLRELGLAEQGALSHSFSTVADPQGAERLYLTSHGLYEILLQEYAHGRPQEILPVLQGLREGVPLDEVLQARLQVNLSMLYQQLNRSIQPKTEN